MRKINKILIGLILVATMFLGIGYSAIQNITLDIQGTATAETSEKILITGQEFNKLLKGSTATSTSDTTITRIVFDYWEYGYIDNETVLFEDGDWSNGIIIDEAGRGGIKLFKSTDETTAYILSEDVIYANSNCADMFYHFEGVTEIAFNNFDTSKVENMYRFFRRCDAIRTLDVSGFNTENVNNMKEMFGGCASLIEINGLNAFKISKVTNMEQMFRECITLSNLDLSSFSTSNVKDMSEMFDGCKTLTELDLNSFNTHNVQEMDKMFHSCDNLIKIDISSFNTSNVNNMEYMFAYDNNLKDLDISSFNTSNVKNMAYMFYMCGNLEKLDISKFDTSNVTNMKAMLGYLDSLKSIDVSNFNTSNVTTMERMFNNSKFVTLDLSSFDTSSVTDMTKMFTNNSNLITIYVSDKWTTEKVDDTGVVTEDQPFYNCTSLVGGAGTIYDNSHVDITYARIDGGTNSETPGYLTLKSSN